MQVANMTAAIASGVHRPVTIRADDPSPRRATRLPVPEPYWRIVRQGMYEAVNKRGNPDSGP